MIPDPLRSIPLMLLGFIFIACSDEPPETTRTDVSTSDSISIVNDTAEKAPSADSPILTSSEWIEDFKAFRDAVYRRDRKALKTYFDFPVTNAEELWYYILADTEDLDLTQMPFAEKEFDRYFDSLFPKIFISTLIKVKSKELAEKGSSESPSIVEENITYQMWAEVDSTDHSLRLSLASQEEIGESSASYVFRIIDGKKLKFVGVKLAG